MRRAAHGEAGPCPSRPRRQKPATSANGDRSPGRSPYRERQSGGKLRRLCRPWLISRQGGAISRTRRDPLQRLPKCGTQQVSRELAAELSVELREVLEPLLKEIESLNERIKEYDV